MKNKILAKLKNFNKKNSTRLSNHKFLNSIKQKAKEKSFLSKLRNSLIIFFGIIVIFKIVTTIAGRYLEGYEFASFIAYFSFFLLVAGGLFFSMYFPIMYGGQKSTFRIKLPKVNFKLPELKIAQKSTRSEKELNSLLKQERKNLQKTTKEKDSLSSKLKDIENRYDKLQKETKEIEKKAKEQPVQKKKTDYGSIFSSLLQKKEVVKKERGITAEMPKIKITSTNKNLAKKFKKLPKLQQQRIELYRSIARNVQTEDNAFTLSQIMEVLLELFRSEVDNSRIKILEEIENWVNEDAYTPLIRTEKGIKYHRIIK